VSSSRYNFCQLIYDIAKGLREDSGISSEIKIRTFNLQVSSDLGSSGLHEHKM